jgi:phosphodiesterase/alkaline phosphatase D-like protein
VTINGLVADTTYYYKIEAKGEAYPKEGTYQFRTLPKSSANQVYPACNLDTFKQYYGKARSDPGFNATYDINQDGIISTIDFFECLKVNPAK